MKIKKFTQLNENSHLIEKDDIDYLNQITSELENSIIDINKTDNLDEKIEKVKNFLEVSWSLRNLMEDLDISMNPNKFD
jgi:hypothetical protein